MTLLENISAVEPFWMNESSQICEKSQKSLVGSMGANRNQYKSVWLFYTLHKKQHLSKPLKFFKVRKMVQFFSFFL